VEKPESLTQIIC